MPCAMLHEPERSTFYVESFSRQNQIRQQNIANKQTRNVIHVHGHQITVFKVCLLAGNPFMTSPRVMQWSFCHHRLDK